MESFFDVFSWTECGELPDEKRIDIYGDEIEIFSSNAVYLELERRTAFNNSFFSEIAKMDLKNLLHSATLQDIKPSKRSVCLLSSSSSILEAAQTLASNRILSAPVVDESGRCMDVIDQIDICVYTLKTFNMLGKDKRGNLYEDNLMTLIQGRSRKDFQTLPHSSSFREVVQALVTVHRVCILDERGCVIDVITQSDIARFLERNLESIGSVANQPLDQLLVTTSLHINRTVFSVPASASAGDAFIKLVEMGVHGVGVVDENGRLVSQVSASFIELSDTPDQCIESLSVPVTEYSHNPIVTLDSAETFGEILKKLVNESAHRGFIVDEQGCPKGVFSLSDVMSVVLGL